MKKIFLILIISVMLTACSGQKIEYTQEEVKYLETMKAAVDQLENYRDKFDVALEKRKNEKSEETAKGLFEGIMAFGMINEVLKKESAPDRFNEVHSEFMEGIGTLSDASMDLSMEQKVDESKKRIEEANSLLDKSSKALLNAYEDAIDSEN